MRFFLMALFLNFLSTTTSFALELKHETGGFTTKNRSTLELINSDKYLAFSYGLLRQAEEINNNFWQDANDLWISIKQERSVSQDNLEVLKALVDIYWEDLNEEQQELAQELKLKKDGHFWQGFETSLGPVCTTLLKGALLTTIITSFVISPVASLITAMPLYQGNFGECQNITLKSFRSEDPIYREKVSILTAQCPFSDGVHQGFKDNMLVFSVNNKSGCNFINNINGTLVISDQADYPQTCELSGAKLQENCPLLDGSFAKSCSSKKKPENYLSWDPRVAEGSLCKYEYECRTKKNSIHMNKLYIPKASAMCEGKFMLNCNGKLIRRQERRYENYCDGVEQHDEL